MSSETHITGGPHIGNGVILLIWAVLFFFIYIIMYVATESVACSLSIVFGLFIWGIIINVNAMKAPPQSEEDNSLEGYDSMGYGANEDSDSLFAASMFLEQ